MCIKVEGASFYEGEIIELEQAGVIVCHNGEYHYNPARHYGPALDYLRLAREIREHADEARALEELGLLRSHEGAYYFALLGDRVPSANRLHYALHNYLHAEAFHNCRGAFAFADCEAAVLHSDGLVARFDDQHYFAPAVHYASALDYLSADLARLCARQCAGTFDPAIELHEHLRSHLCPECGKHRRAAEVPVLSGA